jgi:hypothetical protein
MANKYWVTGGTGNWNSTTNWSLLSGGVSGAPVPSTIDAVILDASSGAGSVTLDVSPDIQTLTMTGFTGTLAFGTNTISLNSTGTVFTGVSTMTVTGTPQIILTNNSATARTITPRSSNEANSISFRITAGTGALTLTAGIYRDLDFTDGTNPTGYAGALANASPIIYGNFKASTGMTKTAGTGVFTFAATSGTKTIITAAVVFDNPFTFDGVGGTWQLQDALTSGATRSCTLTNGTLNLNGYTLTTGFFATSNANTRTLAFGSGAIYVNGIGNSTVYTASDSTNLTVSGNKNVYVTGVGILGNTRTIAGGLLTSNGSSANALNFYISAGADTISLGTANRVFGTLDFTGFSGSTLTNVVPYIYGSLVLSSGMTVTAGTGVWTFAATTSQTITINGKTLDFPVTFNGIGGTWACQDALTLGSTRALTMTNGTLQLKAGTTSTVGSFVTTGTTLKYLQSTTPGTQATISDASGTNTVTYLSVQDSNATGGATWNATDPTNVYVTNNTGWNFGTLAALSGVSATGAVGSLVFSVDLSVTGVQATGTVGSVEFANAYTLSGVQANGAVGNLYTGWYVIPNTQTPSWTNIIQS